MKDYNKIFADENKKIFDQCKELQEKVDKTDKKIGVWAWSLAVPSLFFLIYFNYGWSFLGFRWEWAADFHKKFGEDCDRFPITLIGVVILIVIWLVFYGMMSFQLGKPRNKYIDSYKKMLEEKAKEFAVTTYLNDMISALGAVFTLDATFADTFKPIMLKFEWLDCDGFRQWGTDVMFYYDKDYEKVFFQKKLIVRHEGSKYQLKGWECDKEIFIFHFDKINPNGLVEKDVEFRLPVSG